MHDTNYCQVQNWKKKLFILFMSSTKYSFGEHEMLCTKYHSAILQKGLNWKFYFLSWRKIYGYVLQIYKANFSNTIWFMISEKVYYEVHLSSPWWCMPCAESLSKQGIKNNCVPEFPIFSAYMCTFMCSCDFCRYELVYTYRWKEFKNILETKLCNYFRQL